MIIKKFLAKTEQEAIELAKNDLGSGAVVMNIKKVQPRGFAKWFVKTKVEVTAAIDGNENYMEVSRTEKKDKEEEKQTATPVNSVQEIRRPVVPPMKETLEGTPRVAKEKVADETDSLLDKLSKLENLLEKQVQEKKPAADADGFKKTKIMDRDIRNPEEEKSSAYKELICEQLISNGVEEEIAGSIMEEVDKGLSRTASVDQILASVYQKIILMMGQPYLIDVPKKSSKTKYVFFLGSTGVGKTTTIAKIASKLKLEDNANIALVTADTYRIAAVEQLKTYANILSVPLRIVYSPEELKGSLEELSQYDICLVDTAGRSHKNKEQIREIRELIEQIPIADRQVYLVLSTGAKYNDLQEIAKVYSSLTDFSIIFTKLDETSSAGEILNIHCKTKCPVSYVTWGQNVPEDIGEFNPQDVAKKLLGDSMRN